MSLLLKDVEVEGRAADVVVDRGLVVRVAPAGAVRPGDVDDLESVVDGGGGALLPGLHDHHLHLLAMAAAAVSVTCGPPSVRTADDLAHALRTAPTGPWVRGVGYHESVAGDLDRWALDRWVPDRPVRVQHRSGALWVLNSRALHEVDGALDRSADVERGADGVPTGRLWRYDDRLRPALPRHPPDLAATGRALAAVGITGVTDATPDADVSALRLLADSVASGALPVHVHVLGSATGAAVPAPLTAGPRKLLLRDHDLPTYDELRARVVAEHVAGRAVAVHCVTRESLLLLLAVLDEVGALPGDRVEHAAVVPAGVAAALAAHGLRVVTQPDFLRTRGDAYLRDVDPRDHECLYPHASLLAAGVPVAASSDAPFGDLDPWWSVASAVRRTTRAGVPIGVPERVSAAVALAGYLGERDDPGGPARRVRPSAPADLCLLHVPLDVALREPRAEHVRATILGGRLGP